MTFTKKDITLNRVFPFLLIVMGAVGFLASFFLTMDKFRMLQDPQFHPICSINPIISCGSVASTPQAEAFGFPNMFLGIAGFAMIITVGMAMLAGGKFKPWFWRAFNVGPLFGILFIHWLAFQSVYRINALCIYCIIVWSITIPLFLYTTLYNLREGHLPTPKKLERAVRFVQQHHGDILAGWYLVFVVQILYHFWYYFKTLLP